MTDVIEFLYESQCNEEPESIPELAELYEKESEIFDKIHAALGLKALDQPNAQPKTNLTTNPTPNPRPTQ